MNKIEVELVEALGKVEQVTAKIISSYGGNYAVILEKELNNFKAILFKLLASNAED